MPKKRGHYARDCKVKSTINQLKIDDREKEHLYKIFELRKLIVNIQYLTMS